MAGYRRPRNTPTQRAARKARRRARMAQRYAAATTPAGRLEAAYDYLRGAAARRQPDQTIADQLLDELADALINAADQLLDVQTRERRTTKPTPIRKDAA